MKTLCFPVVLGQFCGFILVMLVSEQLSEGKYGDVFMLAVGALMYGQAWL